MIVNPPEDTYIFLFGGVYIPWSSKKQSCVFDYTQEAEDIACSNITTFDVWINHFMKDMKLDITNMYLHMYCHNQSTIRLIKNGPNNSKGKHVDVEYHYIQDIVTIDEVTISFLALEDMVTYSLTNGIKAELFLKDVSLMGLSGSKNITYISTLDFSDKIHR